MSTLTKADMIAQARAKRGLPATPAAQPARQAPQGPSGGGVPAAVARAMTHPAPEPAAPAAPAQRPAQATAGDAPSRVGVRAPARPPGSQVARVERPEPRRLNVNEVGEDLLRIAGAFSRTEQFQGAPIIVTFEVHVDQRTLGVMVTEAIPGTMHPRFVADGVTLGDVTTKLMRRFRQAS